MPNTSYFVEYSCNYGRNGYIYGNDVCDTSWTDEVPTARAWGYCPTCGKRVAPRYSTPIKAATNA